VPVTPKRIVDTANNVGLSGKLLPGASPRTLAVVGVNGVPASGVSAVLLHVDTKGGLDSDANAGYVWVYSTDLPSHPVSPVVVNAGTGVNSDNMVIVPVGSDGRIAFYNGLNAASVDLIADLSGYVTSDTTSTAGAGYAPLTQVRIADTSTNLLRTAPLSSSADWSLSLLGRGGLPSSGSSIAAVVLNVGSKNPTSNSYVAVTPTGSAYSTANPRVHSYKNQVAEQMVVSPLGTGGQVTLHTDATSTDVFIDVEGYYLSASAGGSGSVYVPITPVELVDTRVSSGSEAITNGQKLSPGQTIPSVHVAGGDVGAPLGVTAVALSLTTLNAVAATGTDGDGSVELWTAGGSRPATSTVNAIPGIDENNFSFQVPSSSGAISIYNSALASTDLVIDMNGFYGVPGPSDLGVVAAPNNWLEYSQELYPSLSLTNTSVSTLDGTIDSEGDCTVAEDGTISSTGTDVYEEEVAFNPVTCQEQVITGTPAQSGVDTLNQIGDSNLAGQNGAAPGVTFDPTDATVQADASYNGGSTTYQKAHIKTAYKDPPHFTITSLAHNIRWPLYGASGTLKAHDVAYAFPWDGWSSSGITLGAWQPTSAHDGWYIGTHDYFTNTDFASLVYADLGVPGWALCGFHFSATAHFHHNLTITGLKNGSSRWHYDDKSNGACSNLVSHYNWGGNGWVN
jgi:hypothetical protein